MWNNFFISNIIILVSDVNRLLKLYVISFMKAKIKNGMKTYHVITFH
jgi:hypothetical protein